MKKLSKPGSITGRTPFCEIGGYSHACAMMWNASESGQSTIWVSKAGTCAVFFEADSENGGAARHVPNDCCFRLPLERPHRQLLVAKVFVRRV
jgi:hypothetical protein